MASCATIRGIKSVEYPKVKQLDIEGTVDKSAPVLNNDGSPNQREKYNARVRFSAQGFGALPEALEAGGSMEVDGYSAGVTGISRTEEEQETGQTHRWSVEATNWPHATPVT
jgi:hypothetical protein